MTTVPRTGAISATGSSTGSRSTPTPSARSSAARRRARPATRSSGRAIWLAVTGVSLYLVAPARHRRLRLVATRSSGSRRAGWWSWSRCRRARSPACGRSSASRCTRALDAGHHLAARGQRAREGRAGRRRAGRGAPVQHARPGRASTAPRSVAGLTAVNLLTFARRARAAGARDPGDPARLRADRTCRGRDRRRSSCSSCCSRVGAFAVVQRRPAALGRPRRPARAQPPAPRPPAADGPRRRGC